MNTVFRKILTAWGIFALTTIALQAQDSFELGEKYTPSRLEYAVLALAIEQRFEDLEDVRVLSMVYPPEQRVIDSNNHILTGSLSNIQLSFDAFVTEENLPQTFDCLMSVHVWNVNDVKLFIQDCKNSQGLILPYFSLLNLIESFGGGRVLK